MKCCRVKKKTDIVPCEFQMKTEMLDNLLEIEVAYSMLKGGDEGEDPIDAHYKKLKTDFKVSCQELVFCFCSVYCRYGFYSCRSVFVSGRSVFILCSYFYSM